MTGSRATLSRTLLLAMLGFLLAAAPAAPDDAVHQAGDPGVEPPRPIEADRTEPGYPEEARAAGVEGRVILRVLVDASGRVQEVEPLRAPYRGEALREAATQAVRGWRYEPARFEGRAIACWITTSVEFYPSPAGPSRDLGTEELPPTAAVSPPAGPAEAASPPSPELDPEPEPPPANRVRGPVPPEEAAGVPPPESSNAATPRESPAAFPPDGRQPLPATVSTLPGAPEPSLPPPTAGPEVPPGPLPPSGRVIRPERGGPEPLALGSVPDLAADPFAAAERLEGDGPVRLRAADLGLELTLGDDGAIRRLRYVFDDPTGTFHACRWRTRSDLGARSSCLGIPPAYGRPDRRQEGTTEEGRAVSSLIYLRNGARAEFRCAGGRLVELVVERRDSG